MPRPAHLVLLFFLLLYLLFPTANSTLDAWYYAGCVKHGKDLFLPHHLLYNAFGWFIFQAIKQFSISVEALAFLKMLNALFATACLAVLNAILHRLNYLENKRVGWLLVSGASFGVSRFATENEVYLLPILLSLGASWCWMIYVEKRKINLLVLSGILAAVACLFHQVQVFWWVGLLVGSWYASGRMKALLAFALPALLVPLVYSLVLVYSEGKLLRPQILMEYVFNDFQKGTAGTSVGANNFLFSGISLVRTFVQVHGLMLYLLSKNLAWLFPALISGLLMLWALLRMPFSKREIVTLTQKISGRIHLLILVLHLFFAWFAVGNAEFMVMIPFLVAMLPVLRISAIFLQKAGAALLVWNFCYGIFPNWKYKLSASDELVQIALEQPKSLFILSDAVGVNNRHFYFTGTEPAPNVVKPPSLLALRNEDPNLLHFLIALQDSSGLPVYTDCLKKPAVISRSSLIIQDVDSAFFSRYKTTVSDSVATFYGWQYLHLVQPNR